jgi:hypothetical protein
MDGRRPTVERPAVDEQGGVDIPLLSKEEAIAEVRRWLDVEQVDPERIFSQMGEIGRASCRERV